MLLFELYRSAPTGSQLLRKTISGFAKDLDAMREAPGFYETFSNFTDQQMPFSAQQSIDYFLPKLLSITLDPSLATWDSRTIFCAWLSSLTLPSIVRNFHDDNDTLQVSYHFSQQFARPFVGNAQLRFLRFVLGVQAYFHGDTTRELYFNGTPIVQSSGTGKTRMVLELANYAPILYICLRSKDSTSLHGFPQSDTRAVDYFSEHLANYKPDDKGKPTQELKYCIDLQVAAFVGAWFQVLADQLSQLSTAQAKHQHLVSHLRYAATPSSSPRGSHPHQAASTEADQASNVATQRIRNQFFNDVCDAAKEILETAPQPGGKGAQNKNIFDHCLNLRIEPLARQLAEVREHLCDQLTEDDRSFLQDTSHVDDQIYERAVVTTEDLDPRRLPIFVAFDECVHLIAKYQNQVDGSDHQLNSLRRAWNHIQTFETQNSQGMPRFWLILMSTNSAASVLIEKSDARGSDRAIGKCCSPTWVNMGFDLMRRDADPLFNARAAGSLEHLRTYGRPLWAALRPNSFFADAQLKLLNSPDSYQKRCDDLEGMPGQQPSRRELHYAILASRVALSFCPALKGGPNYEAVQQDKLATGSVDRHMRILKSIEDGYRLNVTSPSEPSLAIVAAAVMMPLHEIEKVDITKLKIQERYATILTRFKEDCLPVLAHQSALKGSVGELVARILFMVAWDAAKLEVLTSPQPALTRASDNATSSLTSSSSFPTKPVLMLPPSTPAPVNQRFRPLHSPLRLQDLLGQVCKLGVEDEGLVDARLQWVRSQLVQKVNPSDDFPADKDVDLWANYTHFDEPVSSVDTLSCDFLWYCWKRGAAIQTVHNQSGIDGIIPLFVGDLDRAFVSRDAAQTQDADSEAARHMTYIAWQAKHRGKPFSEAAVEKSGLEPFRGPRLEPPARSSAITEKGVLTVYLDLGSESTVRASKADCKMTIVHRWKPKEEKAKVEQEVGKGGGPAERGGSGRKRLLTNVDATAEERASPVPHKMRRSAGSSEAKGKASSDDCAVNDEDDQRGAGLEHAQGGGSVQALAAAAPAFEPTPCQEGFLLIYVRGVQSEDAFPGLTQLNIRSIVSSIVAEYEPGKAKKPFFEQDNQLTMPLDICPPSSIGPVV